MAHHNLGVQAAEGNGLLLLWQGLEKLSGSQDREFISVEWLCWLQDREVPFVIRIRSDRRIGLSPEGPSLPARILARPLAAGEEKVLDGTCHLSSAERKQVELRVIMRRTVPDSGDSEDQFLILATWGVDPEEATALYAQRWEIETMFAALKSRGYRLEETHLTAPDRVQRLVGLLALAFTWTHIVGEKRTNREGPRRKNLMDDANGACFDMGWIDFGEF